LSWGRDTPVLYFFAIWYRLGAQPLKGGHLSEGKQVRYIDTDAQDMTLSYIDQATLEIAELVASAEGISLEEAIAEQIELFEGVTL